MTAMAAVLTPIGPRMRLIREMIIRRIVRHKRAQAAVSLVTKASAGAGGSEALRPPGQAVDFSILMIRLMERLEWVRDEKLPAGNLSACGIVPIAMFVLPTMIDPVPVPGAMRLVLLTILALGHSSTFPHGGRQP